MTLKIVLIINAVIALVFGAALVLVPSQMGSLYGIETTAEMEYLDRLIGAAFLGFAAVTWLARNADDSAARRAIVLGLFIGNTAGFLVALIGQLNNVVNALGWSTVVIYLLLAIGFGYYQFAKPVPKEVPRAAH